MWKKKKHWRKQKIFRELEKSSKKKTYDYWQQREKENKQKQDVEKDSLEKTKKKFRY